MLYRDRLHVFADMLVDRLGTTPLRQVAAMTATGVAPAAVGAAVREAFAQSLPWVEWDEFEARYDGLGDPVSQSLGIANDDLDSAQKEAGSVTIDLWPNRPEFDLVVWITKGDSARPVVVDDPLPVDAADEALGAWVLAAVIRAEEATLTANRRKRRSPA